MESYIYSWKRTLIVIEDIGFGKFGYLKRHITKHDNHMSRSK